MINQRMDYTPFRQTHCRKCKISVEVITERWEVLHHLCAWHVCVEFCSACEAWLEALKQNTKPERGDPFEIHILRYFSGPPIFISIFRTMNLGTSLNLLKSLQEEVSYSSDTKETGHSSQPRRKSRATPLRHQRPFHPHFWMVAASMFLRSWKIFFFNLRTEVSTRCFFLLKNHVFDTPVDIPREISHRQSHQEWNGPGQHEALRRFARLGLEVRSCRANTPSIHCPCPTTW